LDSIVVVVTVYKRSAQEESMFGEFAGHNIQEVHIVNMAALEEYEQNNPESTQLQA
jgi:hypothetical protein